MSQQSPEPAEGQQQFVVVGPDGLAVAQDGEAGDGDAGEPEERSVTDLIEQPAKVMRIGSMIRQLLDEVKAAPLDDAGRTRLASILDTSLTELKDGLAPELDEELDRLVEPFSGPTPSESELRIAQAQLVGWLEGLFSGIQTAIYAQQMAARAQLEQMRRALPPGAMPGGQSGGQSGQSGGQSGHPATGQPGHPGQPGDGPDSGRGGMYL